METGGGSETRYCAVSFLWQGGRRGVHRDRQDVGLNVDEKQGGGVLQGTPRKGVFRQPGVVHVQRSTRAAVPREGAPMMLYMWRLVKPLGKTLPCYLFRIVKWETAADFLFRRSPCFEILCARQSELRKHTVIRDRCHDHNNASFPTMNAQQRPKPHQQETKNEGPGL